MSPATPKTRGKPPPVAQLRKFCFFVSISLYRSPVGQIQAGKIPLSMGIIHQVSPRNFQEG
ncbi:hypothetical protein ES705_29030 [subsurface metagenome]